MNANPCTKSRQTSAFPHPKLPQSYTRIPKGKKWLRNHRKTTKKRQGVMLKRLVKQRKHYLSLARKNLKNQKNFSENRRPEIFSKNGRFSAKTAGLESPQSISRTTLVHKLIYNRHSERLSLRSSKAKSHQQRNIKAFASLNLCP